MKILKKTLAIFLGVAMFLTVCIPALAVDLPAYKYIKLSKEPLDEVHVEGVMPPIAGNSEVVIDEIAYLMPDDATLSISLPQGGTYFVGMAMLDFPAGSGDPGFDQPLVNEKMYADGRYIYRVYDKDNNILEEFRYITKAYSQQLIDFGYTVTSLGEEQTLVFSDVPENSYYADTVIWAVQEGITVGTSATTFSPNKTCNRAQILTFLWRAAGSPEPSNPSNFTDIKEHSYYELAAAWAEENGLVSGTRFEPDTPCTRKTAVEYIWKYMGSPDAPAAAFTDVSSPAVDWALANGITAGTSTTKFTPDKTCTRAQIVTFLYRAFGE